MTGGIRFSTNLITFFNTGIWGLGETIPYVDWERAFHTEPRRYLDSMLDLAQAGGVEGVELAPDPGGYPSIVEAYGSAAAFGTALNERGLSLSSSYAPAKRLITQMRADPASRPQVEAQFNAHAAFTAELGASAITIGNLPRSRFGDDSPDDTATEGDFTAPVAREVHERFADEVNRLGAITAQHGVKLAIHTDAYSICSRPEDIATVLSMTDPAYVALCPDAGHITLDGGDPVAVLDAHLDRIPHMHWKDCIGPLSGHTLRGIQKERHAEMLTHFRILGSGTVDWAAWIDILARRNWSGWAIEEIDMSPEPVEELRVGLDYYRKVLAHRYLS